MPQQGTPLILVSTIKETIASKPLFGFEKVGPLAMVEQHREENGDADHIHNNEQCAYYNKREMISLLDQHRHALAAQVYMAACIHTQHVMLGSALRTAVPSTRERHLLLHDGKGTVGKESITTYMNVASTFHTSPL